ncbi:MAG TPA: MFS transporter, partial [Acidobacteriaceae bacterium]|nr:MFS transporter [Acidobacteriaceae bacterium]
DEKNCHDISECAMTLRSKKDGTIRRTSLLITINACMFVFGIVLLLMGSLLPTLKFGDARSGSLGSFPLVGILVATALVGPVLDKVGAKIALGVALVLIASALAAIPSLGSYAAMAVAALVYGLGAGVLNAATNTLVSGLSASGRGAALNLLGFSFSLGALAVPLLMSLTRGRFSSATVLYILAATSAAILVSVLMQKFPAPTQASTPLGSLLKVLRDPLVWLFGALLFFESCNENCMFVWAGKVAQELLHTSAQRAELVLLGLSASLGAGRLFAVLWLKWIGDRNTVLLSAGITIAGAITVLSSATFSGVATGFCVIGFGLSAIFPTILGMAGDRFPRETGTVFGAIITVGLVGGVAGPVLGSWAATFNPARVLAVPLVAATGVAALAWIVSSRKHAITASTSAIDSNPSGRPGDVP